LRFLSLMLLCCLVACVEAPVVPAKPDPAQPLAKPAAQQRVTPLSQKKTLQQRLRVFLANAQQALADDRLRLPARDNAYDWYRQVLALDELNAEAHWGMRQISKRYMVLAEQALLTSNIDKAERMLQGALSVSATPEQAVSLRKRYQRQSADNIVYLSPSSLSAKDDVISAELSSLAARAKQLNAHLLIVARNDAEARWIYQRMRAAVEGYRLRGNIEVGSVPRIVFIDG
jgi:hypothetical protein